MLSCFYRRVISYAAAQHVYKIGIPAMLKILDLSRMTCFLATGVNESWCSRAYRLQGMSRGWRLFVRIMGENHCAKSHKYHSGR